MTSAVAFISAIVVLLAVPGPTNSLLFLSGADRGFRKSLRLLIGESAGYLAVIVPIAVFAAPYLNEHPAASSTLKLAAASWIMFLAVKLWRRPPAAPGTSSVTIGGIFVTTLLNPKALIIGLTIMPTGSIMQIAPWLALFLVLLSLIAMCWVGAGSAAVMAARGRFDPARLLARTAAVLLAGFSLYMTSAVAGLA
ncbi:hypothetical protein G6L37_02770 [Agrobacterium rubi]|nr:hypothetical protein [Agrobacterium rubi]NTF24304.1 hypothetical protein [Agrobacterium rubi]